MKKTRKILAMVCALTLTAALAVGGTFAYLTAQSETVVNEFTFGNISITLEESPDLDLKMVPGKIITKDPVATVVTGSEACWLFVEIQEANNFDAFMTFAVAEGWTTLDAHSDDDTTIIYREVTAGQVGTPYAVLAGNQVVVKDTVDKAMMDELTNGAAAPTLTFQAYAYQSEGVNEADAITAAAAFFA